ncbi:MAG: tRNA pseudouridine(13) synthase TruD, partial [Candidatus Kariarchaeaceae archaeon]
MTIKLRDEIFHLGPYQWNGKPVGGRLKFKPSDFIVIELDNEIPINLIDYEKTTSGLFLVGTVWKRKIDHSKMLKNIAKTFQVNENDISTGGIKDAFAETTQLFSVYQPRRVPSDPFQPHINIEFNSFRYARERIFPGSMSGNYFDITIRECRSVDKDNIDTFGQWVET